LIVLPAIHFNNDALLMTREVREVRSDRRLAAKVRALNGDALQVPPELSLRIRHFTTKLARA